MYICNYMRVACVSLILASDSESEDEKIAVDLPSAPTVEPDERGSQVNSTFIQSQNKHKDDVLKNYVILLWFTFAFSVHSKIQTNVLCSARGF